MPEPDDEGPQDEQQPEGAPPGNTEALSPATEPAHPLRAQDVSALLQKEIG
jgi:hypothetical protein